MFLARSAHANCLPNVASATQSLASAKLVGEVADVVKTIVLCTCLCERVQGFASPSISKVLLLSGVDIDGASSLLHRQTGGGLQKVSRDRKLFRMVGACSAPNVVADQKAVLEAPPVLSGSQDKLVVLLVIGPAFWKSGLGEVHGVEANFHFWLVSASFLSCPNGFLLIEASSSILKAFRRSRRDVGGIHWHWTL